MHPPVETRIRRPFGGACDPCHDELVFTVPENAPNPLRQPGYLTEYQANRRKAGSRSGGTTDRGSLRMFKV